MQKSVSIILIALGLLSFAHPNDDAEFGHIISAFQYWLKDKKNLLETRSYTMEHFKNYSNLGPLAVARVLGDTSLKWKVHRVAAYDYTGRETMPSYAEIATGNFGNKEKALVRGGYYFVYKEDNKVGQRLIIQPTTSYWYNYNERSYFSGDIVNIFHRDEDIKLMEEFRAEVANYQVEKNVYRGAIVEFVDKRQSIENAQFHVRFVDNVTDFNIDWKDLILESSLQDKAFANTEGFISLLDSFRKIGFSAKKGLLLAGPPGTGKSLLGQLMISNILQGKLKKKATFFSISARHLVYKHTVRILFEEAARLAPSVIFMEDIDLLGIKERSKNDSYFGPADKDVLLNEFLNGMDGILEQDGILMVATTNHFDKVDRALVRSKRLGLHLYFGLPKFPERKRFFERFGKRKATWASDVTVDWLASEAEGFSGADIVELVTLAKQQAYLENSIDDQGLLIILKKHWDEAFAILRQTNKDESFAEREDSEKTYATKIMNLKALEREIENARDARR